MSQFKLGQRVKYKGKIGQITFIDPIYITVCLEGNTSGRLRDVCMVVYSTEWKLIKPVVDCEEIQRRGC